MKKTVSDEEMTIKKRLQQNSGSRKFARTKESIDYHNINFITLTVWCNKKEVLILNRKYVFRLFPNIRTNFSTLGWHWFLFINFINKIAKMYAIYILMAHYSSYLIYVQLLFDLSLSKFISIELLVSDMNLKMKIRLLFYFKTTILNNFIQPYCQQL